MVGIPPMKIVILGMDGLWHLVYHMNLPLNPTLSPSFEIGQEWQYLPRWGAPNRGKKTWNCWWKSDLYHYFGIYPTTTHNMYTYWCDSLSLSLCLPHRFFQTMTFSPPRRTPKQHGCCNATLKRRWKNGFWADEVKWRLKNSWRPSWWALFTTCFWDFGGRFKKHQGELGSWNGDFTGFMPWGTWNEQTTLGPQRFQTFEDFGTPPRRVVGCLVDQLIMLHPSISGMIRFLEENSGSSPGRFG